MHPFIEPISEYIWDNKYRYKINGQIVDQSIEDSWLRVAKGIALAEKQPLRSRWQQKFYEILENFQFLPGGRILAGTNTKNKVTLFNCFVMNINKDSLKAIFQGLKEGAITLQQGGGVGYDFSVLRPHGCLAEKRGVPASGPVSFMHIWDAMCRVLLSTGARRGAMMGVLRCDHPDIEEFIKEKGNKNSLRHFNISVLVTDAFMQAVKSNTLWPLSFHHEGQLTEYKRVKARELWESIIRSAYAFAEPGVLYIDTINRQNNLWYAEVINATNPCGEIPLPPYGACNLGAINLTQFVEHPFTAKARVNFSKMAEVVTIATRFLDNVITVSRYPLTIQRKTAENTRRIGLGLTGLGDFFVMMGVRYGSKRALQLANEVMQIIAYTTWETSIALAREKGRFPLYHKDYLKGEFVQGLPREIREALKKHGVRNSHHNTVAPTGTISLLANNISNGIEPIFSHRFKRNIREIAGNRSVVVQDYAYRLWTKEHSGFPPQFVETSALNPLDHLSVQATLQPYIDNAISKTINLPANFPFAKLKNIYTRAYELGLKGCTVFRPNPITGSILELDEEMSCERCGEGILEK